MPPIVANHASKSRKWCFTWNNYTADHLVHLRERVVLVVEYLAFQPERGATGTPHLQGVVVFKNPRTLSGVASLFANGGPKLVHFEVMRGTIDQAVDYCSKEDSRDPAAGFIFEEHGVRPVGQGVRTDIEAVASLVRDGKRLREIADSNGAEYIKYHRGIQAMALLYQEPRREKPLVYWFWGPTGTGKTRTAYDTSQADGNDPYFKPGTTKWWDGYDGQVDVIIDDYRKDFSTFAEFLRLLDRYPFRVEVKGGTVEFVAKRIYITTPKSIKATFEGTRSEEDVQQLIRRVDEERHFPGAPVVPAMFAAGFVAPA